MEIIGKNRGTAASDIVNDMQITKGAISQIISKPCRKGLLQKSSKAGNMRIHELYLTKKGMEVLFYHEEHERELMKKVMPELKKFRPEDIVRFATILNTVADFAKT